MSVSDNQSQVTDTAVPEELNQLIVMHLEVLGKSVDAYFPDKDFSNIQHGCGTSAAFQLPCYNS